jgi:hypothetical protein
MFDRLFAQDTLLFTIPALLGSVVFLIKLGLMALGGLGADLDLDADADVDIDLGDDVDAGDSTAAFNLLSIQAIAAFLMGFGWGGLGGLFGFDWALPASLLLGAGCGAGMVWMLGLLLKAMYDLETSGNIDIRDAVGRGATVYANVPARGAGRGQVQVVIDDRARIYNAVTDGDTLATGTRVQVSDVNPDHTLTVCAA